ncbi:50S ribosomal protein L29 [Candidatus Nomurabacteria bacterium]|nr:50S ribosomal protein L29 [Candidatus Nomurabacteria bacterium]
MDYSEVKNKSVAGLKELLLEQKEKLRELQFKASQHQLTNVRQIRQIKKDIAVILTALSNKKSQ